MKFEKKTWKVIAKHKIWIENGFKTHLFNYYKNHIKYTLTDLASRQLHFSPDTFKHHLSIYKSFSL